MPSTSSLSSFRHWRPTLVVGLQVAGLVLMMFKVAALGVFLVQQGGPERDLTLLLVGVLLLYAPRQLADAQRIRMLEAELHTVKPSVPATKVAAV
jgi:hypothetical protein